MIEAICYAILAGSVIIGFAILFGANTIATAIRKKPI
jgi:hypothetical protein